MTFRIICVLVLLLSSISFAQEVDKAAIADAEVSRFIDHWTRDLPPKWRRMAYSHKPSVVHWALEYEVDPLLVARIISLESSWRDWVIGSKGEIGLMQIKSGEMREKYDVQNPDENIRAGCELLEKCVADCPTLKAALGKYGTGYCTEKGSWLDRRWKKYQKDVEMFRRR